jgi:hypothetical protein
MLDFDRHWVKLGSASIGCQCGRGNGGEDSHGDAFDPPSTASFTKREIERCLKEKVFRRIVLPGSTK